MARQSTTQPKRLSFTVYFTDEQHEALTTASIERDVPKCQIIRELVNQWRRESLKAQADA